MVNQVYTPCKASTIITECNNNHNMQQERKEVFFSVSERYSCTGNMLLFAPTRSFAFAAYCFDDERARGLDDTRQQANNAQNSDRDVEFPYRIIPYHIARGCLSFWISLLLLLLLYTLYMCCMVRVLMYTWKYICNPFWAP